MSNFQCPHCGMVNIDCEKEGFKTPKELEYEKALKEIEEYIKNFKELDLFEDIKDIINKVKGEGNE